MRNYEIIQKVYDQCPDFMNNDYDFDELHDRLMNITRILEKERPELVAKRNPQKEAGIDY
tara:strand:+ start:387 stop:566 length:180 start_codon:yes stop_codon:yes gene_type:complete